MNMHDAVGQTHLWLDWGQFASLPEPSYITTATHGDKAMVSYQFDHTADVLAWAKSLALTPQMSDTDTHRFVRAILKTDQCELDCYVVYDQTPDATVTPLHPTPPSYGATPCAE